MLHISDPLTLTESFYGLLYNRSAELMTSEISTDPLESANSCEFADTSQGSA